MVSIFANAKTKSSGTHFFGFNSVFVVGDGNPDRLIPLGPVVSDSLNQICLGADSQILISGSVSAGPPRGFLFGDQQGEPPGENSDFRRKVSCRIAVDLVGNLCISILRREPESCALLKTEPRKKAVGFSERRQRYAE